MLSEENADMISSATLTKSETDDATIETTVVSEVRSLNQSRNYFAFFGHDKNL